MKEYVLRRFLEGEYGAADLEADFPGTVAQEGSRDAPTVRRFSFEPMNVDFQVQPSHILKLIDAVDAGLIRHETLDAVCFCLEASAHFVWDVESSEGGRVAESVFWLGTPEINYPLTHDVFSKIRRYLLTGEKLLTIDDTKPRGSGA